MILEELLHLLERSDLELPYPFLAQSQLRADFHECNRGIRVEPLENDEQLPARQHGESLLKEAEGVIKPWLEARDRKEMELLVMKSLYDKTKEERDIAKRPVTRSDSGIASGKTSDGIPTNKQAFEKRKQWTISHCTSEDYEKCPLVNCESVDEKVICKNNKCTRIGF